MLRASFSILFALAICAVAPAFGQVAVNPAHEASFPPVTFGTTETLEVTVANVAGNPLNTNAPAASCTGSVSFLNGVGALIGTASPFTVSSGQTASVTLPFSSAGSSGPRAAIRATITVTPAAASPRPACDLVFSMEITDTTTGVTHAVVTSQASASSLVTIGR